jgi:acetyl-CoA acetyltransferase
MIEAYIPYGAYWSSPFARWQGAFSGLHALKFAAHRAQTELRSRAIDGAEFDFGILGTTIPQQHSFFGAPWVTGMLGAGHVSGPTINQACATSARCLATAAQNLAIGDAQCVLVITADKTSNGPHIYYPQPSGPGGTGAHEDWCSTTSPAIR